MKIVRSSKMEMSMKIPKAVKEYMEAIEVEGLDYATTDYSNSDEIEKVDESLANAQRTFIAARQRIIKILTDRYGHDEDA